MRYLSVVTGSLFVIASGFVVGDALAIDAEFQQGATGICQTPFPSSTVRARPKAISNEGATAAFVSCSPPYNDLNNEEPNSGGLRAEATNNGTATASLSCTLISGTTTSVSVVKSVSIPASQTAFLVFFPSDLPGAPATIHAPNLSCSLPPNMDLNYIQYAFNRVVM